MTKQILTWMTKNRWAGVGAVLAATCVLGYFAGRVGIDNSVEVWFVEGDQALETYRTFQETFGNDEVVAVAVVDTKGIWRAETLNRLYDLAGKIEGIDGIERVHGLPRATFLELRAPQKTGDDLIAADEELTVLAAMDGHVDEVRARALRQKVESDPILRDRLVLAEGSVAMLYAVMARMDDIDKERHRVLVELDEVLDECLRGSGLVRHVAGIGVIYDALNVISQTEGLVFMAAAFLLVFFLLWPLFRTLLAVIVPLAAVGCAVVMTRGLYGLFGKDENMVTMTVPVLVLVLGVADCVHILRYRSTRPDAPPAEVLADIVRPCLFTSLTTMVGFLALATSRMAVVRDLGIFAAIGIGLAFVCSVVACGFAMTFPRFRIPVLVGTTQTLTDSLLDWTARAARTGKETILGLCALAILVSAYGMSKVEVDTYSIGFLPEDHPVRLDNEAMERLVGPSTPLEILVRPANPGEAEAELVLERPEVLQGVLHFERGLRGDAILDRKVRDTISLADVAARARQLNGGEGTPLRVARDKETLAGDLFEFLNDPNSQSDQLLDPERKQLRVTASIPVLSAQGFGDVIERAMKIAKDTLPASVVAEPTGYIPLYVKMMDYVVESQVVSFGSAFVIVFALIGLLFRSVRMMALAVLPNVLPVFVTLGVMGFAGVNLDVATVTITAIIIGIVVDDTIHYLHRFRVELDLSGDFADATRRTAVGVGRPIVATTVLFTLGFLILAFASVKSIAYFGLLTALAMVVALVGDLLVLPALILAIEPRIVGSGRGTADAGPT